MRMNNSIWQRSFIMGCLIIFCFSCIGCEPLRKKFTRKKKENQKNEVEPVLEPIDYPPVHVSPQERYKYSYSMWSVWYKDLSTSLNSNDNDKRVEYLFNQTYEQLVEMDKWLTGDKKDSLQAIIAQYDKINQELQKPQGVRNAYLLRSDLEHNAKEIRHNFAPAKIGDFFIPTP